MKKRNTIPIATLVILLLACTSQINYDTELAHVDSLMISHPDSAWDLLEHFQSRRLKTKADSAYYALLLTQARDKIFVVQTSDSLIRSAVTYYDQTNDLSKQALAHYYYGCICRDSKQCKESFVQFFMAQSLAVQAKKERLLGLIYHNIGHLYYIQDLNEQADSVYQLAEQVAIRLHELPFQGEMLWQRGKILMEKGEGYYPKAEALFLQALDIANRLSYKPLIEMAFSSLSLLYNRMGNGEKSLKYSFLNLGLQSDTLQCYEAYQQIGSAYCQLSKYDSASYYLNKALQTTDYAIKTNVYRRLAEIARKQGHWASAAEMERYYSVYSDSLRQSNQAIELVRAEKELQLDRQKKEHDKHLAHFRIYLGLILGTFILIVFLLFKRFCKKTALLQREKEAVAEKQEVMNLQQIQIKEKLLQKERAFVEFQKAVEHEKDDEHEKQLLHTELEQLQMERMALLQESYKHADVMVKMKSIVSDYKLYDKSKEVLLEEDWRQLVVETDQRWNNITLKLHAKYDLSQDEIRLCCLYLTDFPVNTFGYLLECTRDAIYKKANRIVEQKMGYPHKTVVLRELLKHFD